MKQLTFLNTWGGSTKVWNDFTYIDLQISCIEQLYSRPVKNINFCQISLEMEANMDEDLRLLKKVIQEIRGKYLLIIQFIYN